MRFLLPCVLFLVLASFGLAQESYDTFGKTEKEIVAMGESGWHDFYEKKTSQSTMDEVNAYGIFAQVMGKRNDQIALQQHRKSEIVKLRKILWDGGNAIVDLGSNISEGGTLWHIIYANLDADIETAINGYLEKKPGPKEHYVVSDFTKQIGELADTVEEYHKDPTETAFHYEDAKKSLAEARRDFAKAVAFASHCSRADSDRFLGIYVIFAKTSIDMK